MTNQNRSRKSASRKSASDSASSKQRSGTASSRSRGRRSKARKSLRKEIARSTQEIARSRQEIELSRQEIERSRAEIERTRTEIEHSRQEIARSRQEPQIAREPSTISVLSDSTGTQKAATARSTQDTAAAAAPPTQEASLSRPSIAQMCVSKCEFGENQEWVYVEQPRGEFKPENFELRDCAEPADLEDGEVTVQTLYLSVDPYMRVLMKDDNVAGIFPNFKVGTVPGGAGVGCVIASRNANFQVGDHLSGFGFSWRKRQNMNPAGLAKVPDTSVPLHNYISILGMTGHTALLPILKWSGEPKEGQTAYVSAAAGAVGSIAGQVFKSLGMRVVGSAGSAEKLEYLKSIGFDAVFNYKETSVADGLKTCAPDGVDVFFDSVGGPTLEAAIDAMNRKGLIIKCGSISDYNNPDAAEYGIKNMGQMLWKCLSMHGYIFSDLMPEFPEAQLKLLAMVKDGSLKQRTMIVDGFDGLAHGFEAILSGKNIGKVVIKI